MFQAKSRSQFVVDSIFNFNHPFAALAAGELRTKMQKMGVNAFAFFRGTAHLFYEDLRIQAPSGFSNEITSKAWINGDLHLANFGAFRDAAGETVFDVTDFDEAYLAPFNWDLQRLSVSIVLAAQELGCNREESTELVEACIKSYLEQLAEFRGNDKETSFQLSTKNSDGLIEELIKGSQSKSRRKFLEKYTETDAKPCFLKSNPELEPVDPAMREAIEKAFPEYLKTTSHNNTQPSYELLDICQKLGSGTGSLGRLRFWLLLKTTEKTLILEMKQAVKSCVGIAIQDQGLNQFCQNHEGHRVAMSLQAHLSQPDPLTGYVTVADTPYFLREKSPYQEAFDYTTVTRVKSFMTAVAAMGQVLAKAHARADKDFNPAISSHRIDKAILELIGDHEGLFIQEIIDFAHGYAAQVRLDWQDFVSIHNKNGVLY